MSGALREILASFGVEFDKEGNLEKGDHHVDELTEKLLGFGKIVGEAFAIEKIVDFTKEIIGEAVALSRQAAILGTSTKELEEWQYAAERSGIAGDEFTGVVSKLSRNINEASESATGPAAKAFKALGVHVKDASGNLISPIDALDQLTVGFQGITDPAKRTALAMDLFGRSGAQLLPFLAKGPDGIAKLRAEVEELGAGMDDTFIAGAKEYKGNVARLNLAIKGLGIQVIGPLLPVLGKLTTYAVGLTKSFVGWIKQTTFVRTALAALTIGGVRSLLGSIPKLVGMFGGLSAILTRVALFAARVVAPFLLLDDVIGFLSGDESVIGDLIDKAFGSGAQDKVRSFFGLLKNSPEEARAEFKDYADSTEWGKSSFMRGWNEGLLEEVLFVTNALTGGWANFFSKARVAGQGFMLALKIVWTEIKFAGLEVAAALSDAFDATWNGIVSGAQAAINAMIDVLAKLPGTTDAVKDLRAKVKSLDAAKGNADAGEIVTKQRDKARLAIAEEGDRIGSTATAEAVSGKRTTGDDNSQTSTTIAPETHIHVTVEGGGSPADVGNRVGKAAAKAAAPINLNAAKAALVPTPGWNP